MEIQYADMSPVRLVFDTLKELMTDVNVDVDPHQKTVSLQSLDTTHVALISAVWDRFSHFHVEQPVTLGMNLETLVNVCALARDDTLTLKHQAEDAALQFVFESTKESRMMMYTMRLKEIETDRLSVPETDYKSVLDMPSKEFEKIMRDMSGLGDTVTICINKEGVRFSVLGDSSSGLVVCRPSSDVKILSKHSDDFQLSFAFRYLCAFAKASPLAATVRIKMQPDAPICIQYRMCTNPLDPDTSIGLLTFHLAPKLEETASLAAASAVAVGGDEAGVSENAAVANASVMETDMKDVHS